MRRKSDETLKLYKNWFFKSESDHVLIAEIKDITLKHLDSTPCRVLDELLATISKMEKLLGGTKQ